jgi:hypothetical protein
MALDAERPPIVQIEPKLGMRREGLDVIGVELATPLSTPDAGVVIALEDALPPLFVGVRRTDPLVDWCDAALPSRVVRARPDLEGAFATSLLDLAIPGVGEPLRPAVDAPDANALLGRLG